MLLLLSLLLVSLIIQCFHPFFEIKRYFKDKSLYFTGKKAKYSYTFQSSTYRYTDIVVYVPGGRGTPILD